MPHVNFKVYNSQNVSALANRFFVIRILMLCASSHGAVTDSDYIHKYATLTLAMFSTVCLSGIDWVCRVALCTTQSVKKINGHVWLRRQCCPSNGGDGNILLYGQDLMKQGCCFAVHFLQSHSHSLATWHGVTLVLRSDCGTPSPWLRLWAAYLRLSVKLVILKTGMDYNVLDRTLKKFIYIYINKYVLKKLRVESRINSWVEILFTSYNMAARANAAPP